MGESADAAAGGSSGGLFFVLNVLGFCGCIVGCAYNYAVLQKRGEEIIPGIGEFGSLSPLFRFYHVAGDMNTSSQNTFAAPGSSSRVCSSVAQGWLRPAAASCPAPKAISLCERKGFGHIPLWKMVRLVVCSVGLLLTDPLSDLLFLKGQYKYLLLDSAVAAEGGILGDGGDIVVGAWSMMRCSSCCCFRFLLARSTLALALWCRRPGFVSRSCARFTPWKLPVASGLCSTARV